MLFYLLILTNSITVSSFQELAISRMTTPKIWKTCMKRFLLFNPAFRSKLRFLEEALSFLGSCSTNFSVVLSVHLIFFGVKCRLWSMTLLFWHCIELLMQFWEEIKICWVYPLQLLWRVQYSVRGTKVGSTQLKLRAPLFGLAPESMLSLLLSLSLRNAIQCTVWLSIALGSSKVLKSKILVLAQFWSKSDNSSSDWGTTVQILEEKYSRKIFAKNGISIGKKPERGVRPIWNLVCNNILWCSEKNLKITFWSRTPFIVKMEFEKYKNFT